VVQGDDADPDQRQHPRHQAVEARGLTVEAQEDGQDRGGGGDEEVREHDEALVPGSQDPSINPVIEDAGSRGSRGGRLARRGVAHDLQPVPGYLRFRR
jgi:hypothetical protein